METINKLNGVIQNINRFLTLITCFYNFDNLFPCKLNLTWSDHYHQKISFYLLIRMKIVCDLHFLVNE